MRLPRPPPKLALVVCLVMLVGHIYLGRWIASIMWSIPTGLYAYVVVLSYRIERLHRMAAQLQRDYPHL